jgi:hypothetical protein
MMAYEVVRIPGRDVPLQADCDDCDWSYEGQQSIKEARAHTLTTAHDTSVTSEKIAWYSRMGQA